MKAIKHDISALWQKPDLEAIKRVEAIFQAAPRGCLVFFRADDVAMPSQNWQALAETFSRTRMPLSPALVPAWLSPDRWEEIHRPCLDAPELFGWHQHGWRHHNHEPLGAKKHEFGPAREQADKERDLARGWGKLAEIVGPSLQPVFTPPWNKIDPESMEALRKMGFKAISRSVRKKPVPLPKGLADFPINVDLHTRQETDPAHCWQAFYAELTRAAQSGTVGFMIHHQRMNRQSHDFMELLLSLLKQMGNIEPLHLGEMASLKKNSTKTPQ